MKVYVETKPLKFISYEGYDYVWFADTTFGEYRIIYAKNIVSGNVSYTVVFPDIVDDEFKTKTAKTFEKAKEYIQKDFEKKFKTLIKKHATNVTFYEGDLNVG